MNKCRSSKGLRHSHSIFPYQFGPLLQCPQYKCMTACASVMLDVPSHMLNAAESCDDHYWQLLDACNRQSSIRINAAAYWKRSWYFCQPTSLMAGYNILLYWTGQQYCGPAEQSRRLISWSTPQLSWPQTVTLRTWLCVSIAHFWPSFCVHTQDRRLWTQILLSSTYFQSLPRMVPNKFLHNIN